MNLTEAMERIVAVDGEWMKYNEEDDFYYVATYPIKFGSDSPMSMHVLFGALCERIETKKNWTYKGGSRIGRDGYWFQIFSFGLAKLPVQCTSDESLCHAAALAYLEALESVEKTGAKEVTA